jgi:hypothetical protein
MKLFTPDKTELLVVTAVTPHAEGLLIEGKIYKHGTAEELAADEEVRRLYLGRNFELKRKDYLHEEALKDRGNRE